MCQRAAADNILKAVLRNPSRHPKDPTKDLLQPALPPTSQLPRTAAEGPKRVESRQPGPAIELAHHRSTAEAPMGPGERIHSPGAKLCVKLSSDARDQSPQEAQKLRRKPRTLSRRISVHLLHLWVRRAKERRKPREGGQIALWYRGSWRVTPTLLNGGGEVKPRPQEEAEKAPPPAGWNAGIQSQTELKSASDSAAESGSGDVWEPAVSDGEAPDSSAPSSIVSSHHDGVAALFMHAPETRIKLATIFAWCISRVSTQPPLCQNSTKGGSGSGFQPGH